MYRKSLLKNKRGTMEDVIFIAIIAAVFAIFILVMAYITPQISDKLRGTEINNSAAARTALDYSDTFAARLNSVFLIVFVGLIMGMLVSAFLIEAHPIFIPIFIFFLGFAVVAGVVMSNVYESFSDSTEFAATAAQNTYVTAILDNYVLIIIVVGVLSMILTFGKLNFGTRERL